MKGWFWIGLAIAVTIPGLVVRFVALNYVEHDVPLLGAFLFGMAVVGSAFLLSWAIEVAQLDIPQALALSVLALIAVLPEYAVDFSLTYRAGSDPSYQEFAIANMIGANRMIVGFAWPLIIFIFALKFRKKRVYLDKNQRVEIGFLLLAGLYSLSLPLKGHIDFYDVVVFVGLFIVYTFRISKAEVHEPELIGPAELVGRLPRRQRLTIVSLLLLFAATVIFLVAHSFAESLIATGTAIGVDEVFMVQWFAPLASEAPEIVVCVLFTLRGLASDGLGALVASKVNQWTLLVGTLPLVFSLGAGQLRSLPLHGSYIQDGKTLEYDLIGPMLVTSAQTLLAVMIILNLRAGLTGAGILIGLLLAQFIVPIHISNFFGIANFDTHYLFAGVYLTIASVIAFRERKHFVSTFKSVISPKYVQAQLHPEEEHRLETAEAESVPTARN